MKNNVSFNRAQIRMLYGSTKSCPICGSVLNANKCNSGCFEYNYYNLVIFGKIISTNNMECDKITDEHIAFWKENDRYLTEIMK